MNLRSFLDCYEEFFTEYRRRSNAELDISAFKMTAPEKLTRGLSVDRQTGAWGKPWLTTSVRAQNSG